ncbi:MAG: serine hydrolase [Bacteroidales bacterium]|nr:serine hydrolase [Bacteroidales bacterium]MBN2820031.1 serine hydrolase [Bacteroidales bacterium]
MRGSVRKFSIVLVLAVITGIFFQFSMDLRTFHEAVLPAKKQLPPFLIDSASWSDSVFFSLTTQDKIAQMMMIAAYPQDGEADKQRITKLIKQYNIGGIIFFQSSVEEVAQLAGYYQSISRIPLLIAVDGEWGLAMRFSNTIKYPKQMMLGAVSDEMLIYEMGRDIAMQMKQLGINVNFAPVIDINNNPENPVINSRSFGEQRVNVARKGLLYMKGMQNNGVLAFAKHFPGHGDTKTDSHHGLPLIDHSRARLDSLELYPFRALINGGVGGVMIAHMNVTSLDPTPDLPSTLSPLIVDSLLKKQLGFKGLVVTDAMGMGGITDFYEPTEANTMAVMAGNDILLMPHEAEKSIQAISEAIDKKLISFEDVNQSCRKILRAKQWVFSDTNKYVFNTDSINRPEYLLTRQKLVESAITVVKNENSLVPLQHLDTLKIAHVYLGSSDSEEFISSLDLYAKVDDYKPNTDSEIELKSLFEKLENYNLVIVSIHSNSLLAGKNFNFNNKQIQLVDKIIKNYPALLCACINPYALGKLQNLNEALGIIEAYESDSVTQKASVQVIFGAIPAAGKLPVSINETFVAGTGIRVNTLDRFKYVTPFEAGFDEKKLQIIDSLVSDAIRMQAMPGCQVLAARNGQVFFYKNYGYHTYRKKLPVKTTDLYDLASLTKISATLPALIYLQNENKFDPGKKLKDYFSYLDTCEKGDMILSDVLAHQAGLKAWIPFYWSTLEPAYPSQDIFSTKQSVEFPIQIGTKVYANKHLIYKKDYFDTEPDPEYPYHVADKLFLRSDFADSIWIGIINSEMGTVGEYKYSDLGFYILQRLIEQQTNIPLEKFVDSVFYKSIGAYTLGYNPLEHFDKDDIVPTENDLIFRKQLIQGYVHDPGAAMLGGVCGHAGLFGSANDLAKLMNVYMNKGRYGGKTYLNRRILSEYTACYDCDNGNRRAMGFDKPQPDTTLSGPSFKGISTESFGHTGFTGTMTWMDPDTGILYVFLSNRVYPDAMNNLLVKLDVRTKIQKAIYDAMLTKNQLCLQ